MKSEALLAYRILQSNLGELSLPYRMTFSVTSRCQARCNICNIWKKPDVAELSLSEIDTLFTQAGHFSWINLTGGELFQRDDIQEIMLTIIRRSRNLCLLNFPTNGIQTDAIVSAVTAILESTPLPRLIVSVSLDGPPELHDRIRGVTGCWQQAVETFRKLRELRSRRFSVYFGHTIQKANLGAFDDTRAVCALSIKGLNMADFHVNLAHTSEHYYDNADRDAILDPSAASRELSRISAMMPKRAFSPVSFIEKHYHAMAPLYLASGRTPLACQAAAASCFMDPTGIVYPCTVFDAPIGSLRDCRFDFKALWHSRERKTIRNLILKHDCPGCWTPCEAYQTILANILNPDVLRSPHRQ